MFFRRIKSGWRLAGVSWRVLRSDRSLAAFPGLGALASFFLLASFGLPSALAFYEDLTVVGVILAGLAIYAATFAGVFFSVALAAAAASALDGDKATVRGGVAVAGQHTGAIAGWAGVLASVNIIINALQDRAGPIVGLLLGFLAVAWSLVTFLVVPIIAIEGLGPVSALKRSASIFRERWGEQVTGQMSISLIAFLIAAVPVAVLVALGIAMGSLAALIVFGGLAAVILVVAVVISAALTQIFAVALYRYATGEGSTGAFSTADLESAVGPRRRARWAS